MPTREILAPEWKRFFDSFASSHRAWLITVRITSPELGAQTWIHDLPLKDLTVDREADGTDRLLVDVGSAYDTPAVHVIRAPRHVFLKSTDEGTEETLEILGPDGTQTLLTFQSAMLPQLVDGVTADQV